MWWRIEVLIVQPLLLTGSRTAEMGGVDTVDAVANVETWVVDAALWRALHEVAAMTASCMRCEGFDTGFRRASCNGCGVAEMRVMPSIWWLSCVCVCCRAAS